LKELSGGVHRHGFDFEVDLDAPGGDPARHPPVLDGLGQHRHQQLAGLDPIESALNQFEGADIEAHLAGADGYVGQRRGAGVLHLQAEVQGGVRVGVEVVGAQARVVGVVRHPGLRHDPGVGQHGGRLGDGQGDGGQVHLVAQGAQLTPQHLEGGLALEQLALDLGHVVEVDGLLQEAPQAGHAGLGGADAALEVDDPLGHVIGADRLVDQLPHAGQALQRGREIGRKHLEHDLGPGLGLGAGRLGEHDPAQALDYGHRLVAGRGHIVGLHADRGPVHDLASEVGGRERGGNGQGSPVVRP